MPHVGTSRLCRSVPGDDNFFPAVPKQQDGGLPNTDHMHVLPLGTPSFARIRERYETFFLQHATFLKFSLSLFFRFKKCPVVGPYSSSPHMKVARGSKQWIYDDGGGQYLDCFNATAHVGHCHPQVCKVTQPHFAQQKS